MDEVNRRNAETIAAKLKEMESKVFELSSRFDTIHSYLSGVDSRINRLEQMVLNFKAKITGSGASVE